MATAADKKKWDSLHAAYMKAKAARDELEIEMHVKYGRGNEPWWPKSAKTKFEKLRERQYKIGEQISELILKISPRGDRWFHGAPAWWVYEKLTWEDAIRPANEPLSVVVPGSYGNPDGTVKETREANTMEIIIPEMGWTQISGDMDPSQYGAIIARGDGHYLELVEIQPVREYVSDDEARDVGFPFWSKEAHYDLADLDLKDKDVKSALESYELDDEKLADMQPPQRALAIAEALMRYGVGSEEGPGGWSKDVIFEPVKWWSGAVAGAEYLADEDDEFRREILGDEDEDDEDDEDDDDDLDEDVEEEEDE